METVEARRSVEILERKPEEDFEMRCLRGQLAAPVTRVEGPGDTDVRRSDIRGAAAQTPLADARTTAARKGDSLLFVV